MNPAYNKYREELRGKAVTVIGLGVSNRPLVRMLVDAGAHVTVRDKNAALVREGLEGVTFCVGEDYLNGTGGDIVYRTPGLRPDHPALLRAKADGSRVTSEMEDFFALCPCPITAVTGSDGKTTTTTLIAEMLRKGGHTVHLGGNIGVPLLTMLCDISPDDRAVVELSSFQLMDMTRSPQTAVITNITPNHLDWHKDMDEYIAAKRVIIEHQDKDSLTILNGDNPLTAALCGRGNTMYFGGRRIRDGKIDGFLPITDIQLSGHYQIENMMAALSAVRNSVSDDAILEVAKNFTGVPHRNEYIATVNGVAYYNNSIGSSPARTMATLRAHAGKVILIAGGRDKKVPFDELAAMLPEHVKRLLLIGEAADAIEQAARTVPGAPQPERCADLADAVVRAYNEAVPGDTVLLSPACTAFDAYKNFEERGRHFETLVRALQR